jgi:hypothetical protein
VEAEGGCVKTEHQRDFTKWKTSPTGYGKGDLWDLFEGEELRMMLFNFQEAGLILKAEPM